VPGGDNIDGLGWAWHHVVDCSGSRLQITPPASAFL
jgi:hypothetical protein